MSVYNNELKFHIRRYTHAHTQKESVICILRLKQISDFSIHLVFKCIK